MSVVRIQKDCSCINGTALEIIQFWFGGDQQVNYRTKWFPEGSSAQQEAIDLEIYTKYNSFLELANEEKLNSWMNYRTSCIALIILLDQFSRHIYRHLKEPADSPKRKRSDTLALQVSKALHEHSELVMDLPIAEYVFSLMPLRHNQSIPHLEFILGRLTDKENYAIKGNELLERFRKQTTRRLQHLQDRERLEATDDILERHPFQADESDIMKDPLVVTTEAFLKRTLPNPPYSSEVTNPQVNRNVLIISLSGGVDSMVISKILQLLQKAKKVQIDEIVALHIDYANRPESGREADYVKQWSESLGIHCHIRTINEVTRGITDRDAYEKISRNIRYSFYQENIALALQGKYDFNKYAKSEDPRTFVKYNVSGIIFGHHLGDVQENVISNVMRGSGPLDLSGMTETSLVNNVYVWRPLLQHVKEDIYHFAHKYGVPYFKDSTPSWSTRGKLRNQLIPLLVSIYGEGCLRNLSNLAHESDQTQELVYQNLYQPFFNSVKRSSCGLAVNIIPYRHQPNCFWKEVLKQLMHSMSMSMIRDKAVSNFVERIQRVTLGQLRKSTHLQNNKTGGQQEKKKEETRPQQPQNHHKKDNKKNSTELPDIHSPEFQNYLLPAGWLELRKGYHTYLNEKNDLIILKEGVLFNNLVTYNPVTTKNQQMQQVKGKKENSSKKPATATTETTKAGHNGEEMKNEPQKPVISLKCGKDTKLFILQNRIQFHISSSSSSSSLTDELAAKLRISSSPAATVDPSIASYSLAFDAMALQELSKTDYGTELHESLEVSQYQATNQQHSLKYGPWKISIELGKILSAGDYLETIPKLKEKLLKNVEDLLNEQFSYSIYWPIIIPNEVNNNENKNKHRHYEFQFILLKEFLQLFEQFITEQRTSASVTDGTQYFSLAHHFFHDETTLFPDIIHALSMDLRGMEVRLRDGLPFFIPCIIEQSESGEKKIINHPDYFFLDETDTNATSSSVGGKKYFVELKLSYQFEH